MPFCRNCGTQLEEAVKFCPECGTAQASAPTQETEKTAHSAPIVEVAVEPAGSRQLNVGQLVWSILNLVFCCMPLAIVSLVMTVLAKDAPTAAEEAKKIKTAKTCNLIATIGSAAIYILYFIFVVVIGVLSAS